MPRIRNDERSPIIEGWYALWLTAGVGLLGAAVESVAGYRSVGFLFLVHVMLLGLRYSMGPVLFAAALSALAWDFLFIPPRFTFAISTSEDLMMLLAYAVAAGLTGALTHRLRCMQEQADARDRLSQFLVGYARLLASEGGRDGVAMKALESLEARFDLRAALSLADDGVLLSPSHFLAGERERELLAKAARAGSAMGWDGLFPRHLALPLTAAPAPACALLLRKDMDADLGPEDQELLRACADQLAQYLQRESLREKSLEAARLRESELLHQALMDSVSHELRTPLTSLLGSAAALEDPALLSAPQRRQALLEEVRSSGERLNRVIENLLGMARLNSGALALRKEWHDPAELARLTVQRLKSPLSGHTVTLDLPAELPLLQLDYRLMEHALSNLLLNAAVYAPAGSEIRVGAALASGRLQWRVADEGPGIPEEDLDRVFDKFFRVPGSPAGGTGLGLYITRSLLRAHGGEAKAFARRPKGTEFVLSVPVEPSPALPAEALA